MKKILVILGEYPVVSSPTSLAASFTVEKLQEIYDVYPLEVNKFFSKSFVKYLCKDAASRKIVDKLELRIKQLFSVLIYPIIHPLAQRKINRKALNICREKRIDCVIGVEFPFEAVVAANYVKKKIPSVKYLAYMIDAYSCGTMPKYLPTQYAFDRRLNYERKNVRDADLVIAMESSREFHQKFNDKYYKNIKYLNPAFFTNRVPPQHIETVLKKGMSKNINIVYTGYLYNPDRNPTYIIRLLSSLKNPNIHLIFIGKSEIDNIIEDEKKEFCGKISNYGYIPHDQLHTAFEEADVLLHLGAANGNAISGKIFEYMSYGKPILAVYQNKNEATLPYLKKYGLSCCIEQDERKWSENRTKIKSFLEGDIGKTVSREKIQKAFYTSTPQAFVDQVVVLLEE